MRSASPATPANWRGAASSARRCWTYCGSHISSATRCTTSRYRGRPSANSTATTRSAATQSGRNWASLIAALHAKGVYFRSLHLGNVVRTPEGRMGLIDIADLRVQRSALSAAQRIRNFKHLLRYEQDRTWFLDDSEHLVLKSYLRSSQVHWTLEQLLKQLQLD